MQISLLLSTCTRASQSVCSRSLILALALTNSQPASRAAAPRLQLLRSVSTHSFPSTLTRTHNNDSTAATHSQLTRQASNKQTTKASDHARHDRDGARLARRVARALAALLPPLRSHWRRCSVLRLLRPVSCRRRVLSMLRTRRKHSLQPAPRALKSKCRCRGDSLTNHTQVRMLLIQTSLTTRACSIRILAHKITCTIESMAPAACLSTHTHTTMRSRTSDDSIRSRHMHAHTPLHSHQQQ